MRFVKCYDVVSMVVEEADKQFGSMWRLNRGKQFILKSCCEIIDEIAQEFDGVSYEVSIDDITTDISIQLTCSDIVIESENHKFYQLAKRAKSINISVDEDKENLSVVFVLQGVWNKTL